MSGHARPPAVDGIKIFDNDDQATKYYCCQPTAKFTGRNLEFPGLRNAQKCVGWVTFPVHGMYISYYRKFVHFLEIS